MANIAGIIGVIQLFFALVIGLYFWNLLRNQQTNKVTVYRDSKKELDKLHQLKKISLSQPLAEKTRPCSFEEIIGQDEGLKALRAALCGPNPQHVIIYGPPGIGKTAAARVILEESKKNPHSPFNHFSKFVELDATIARFDERGIADPLIGSVHDPIYQGAGPMGAAGIPQPKPGAITRAHGGILFIDEIGELHSIQMNKLLKVLEDRKVFLESAYYSSEDPNIPEHIHEIFQMGLPADFRLVGATTRTPEHIPPALRSRCMEIFFRGLHPEEVKVIARNAAKKINFTLAGGALEVVSRYAHNGREAVNIVQVAAGVAQGEGRGDISPEQVEWVVNSSQLTPRPEKIISSRPQRGMVNGLAVYGGNQGSIIEIEVVSFPAAGSRGRVTINGIIEEEEMRDTHRVVRRKGMARSSIENVLILLQQYLDLDPTKYDIHLNFPGGMPVDGPSAGIAMATAICSSLKNMPVVGGLAMTGEVSIQGLIKPVGGIPAKLEAARRSGAKKVIIPRDNWQAIFKNYEGIKIIAVERLEEALEQALVAPDIPGEKSINQAGVLAT